MKDLNYFKDQNLFINGSWLDINKHKKTQTLLYDNKNPNLENKTVQYYMKEKIGKCPRCGQEICICSRHKIGNLG